MVMDAVAEPDAFQVDGERAVEVAVPIAFVVCVDGFEQATDTQVVAPVLVEEDVADCSSVYLKSSATAGANALAAMSMVKSCFFIVVGVCVIVG